MTHQKIVKFSKQEQYWVLRPYDPCCVLIDFQWKHSFSGSPGGDKTKVPYYDLHLIRFL